MRFKAELTGRDKKDVDKIENTKMAVEQGRDILDLEKRFLELLATCLLMGTATHFSLDLFCCLNKKLRNIFN